MFYKTGVSVVLATSESQLDLFKHASDTDTEKVQEEDCKIKADAQEQPSV